MERQRSGKDNSAPFARREVDLEALAIVELALIAPERDGEDDDFRVGKVRIHPTIAHIQIGCLLGSAYDEDGCSLRTVSH